MKKLVLTILIQVYVFGLAVSSEDHPCNRKCTVGNRMICQYTFDIKWFRTLSKSCGSCLTNTTDCYKDDCIAGDGYSKPIITVNEQLPGPSISVCEGDTVVVDVENHLVNGDATTIHWHGMYQRGTQWMDGVPMLTQCPIEESASLQYTFVAQPAGTHWWHAHSGLQRGDGSAGPLIVRKPSELDDHSDLYDIDTDDHVVMVSDWFHASSLDKYTSFQHGDYLYGITAENVIINGRGQSTETASTNTPLAEFKLTPNKRTRFRVISNAVLYCTLEMSIDDHNLTVISSDGHDIKPVTVSTLTIQPGERYDFIVNADQKPSNYWMRVKGVEFTECSYSSQKAIVRYDDLTVDQNVSPASIENEEISNLNPMLHQADKKNPVYVNELRSIKEVSNEFRGTPDEVLFFELKMNFVNYESYLRPGKAPTRPIGSDGPFVVPVVNGITFKLPDRPLLYQYDSADKDKICNSDDDDLNVTKFKQCVHTVKVPRNKLIEMVIFDKGVIGQTSGHPMHLHGQSFAVVAMNRVDDGNETLSMDKMKKIYYEGEIPDMELINPPLKDTVIVPNRGYTIVRFFSDNPGFWAFHCHIEFHLDMMVVIQVGEPDDIYGVPKDFPRCGSYKSDIIKQLPVYNRAFSTMTYNIQSIFVLLLCVLVFNS